MTITRIGATVALCFSLSGCGVMLQRQQAEDNARLTQTCDFSHNPDLEILSGKIPLTIAEGESPSLFMLTLDRTANEPERQALLAFDAALNPCRTLSRAFIQKWGGQIPEAQSIVSSLQAIRKGLLADLYLGKLTFAQYVRQSNAATEEAKATLAKIVSAYDARQQALAASYYNTYMASIPKQVTTTCSGGSGFATCTTR